MTDETVELTIKTTARGLQELMATMPGLAAVVQDSAPSNAKAANPQSTADTPAESNPS